MKKIFCLIYICLISCTPNFDPEKDSDIWPIILNINTYGALSAPGAKWEKASRPKLSVYCFEKDTLISSKTLYPESFFKNSTVQLDRLNKGQTYNIAIIADYDQLNEFGVFKPRWFHIRNTNRKRLHLERADDGYLSINDIIAYSSFSVEPSWDKKDIVLSPVGNPCTITLLNTDKLQSLNWVLTFQGLYSFPINEDSLYSPSDKAFPLVSDNSFIVDNPYIQHVWIVPNSDGNVYVDYTLGKTQKIKKECLHFTPESAYELEIDMNSGKMNLRQTN